MSAGLLRKTSHLTNLYAGDGTTTSTIIATNIIRYKRILKINNFFIHLLNKKFQNYFLKSK